MSRQVTINSGGSLVVTVSFKNESGQATVPTEIKWTLTDANGAIINGRLDVVVAPAGTVYILLGANDNPATDVSQRIVTVTAKYLSSLVPGEEMPVVAQHSYYVNSILEPVS